MSLTPAPDVLVAHLAGEAVLLNLGDKSYYRLNETAAVVWSALERGETREGMLAELVGKYQVDTAEASRELDRVLADLASRGLVGERGDSA